MRRAFLLGIAAFVAPAMATVPAAARSEGFKNTVEAYLMGASMAGTVGAGPVSPSSTVGVGGIYSACAGSRSRRRTRRFVSTTPGEKTAGPSISASEKRSETRK
jgi:hypothetical protein